MKRFSLAPAARDDLSEISRFIRRDNPRAADRILLEFHHAMRRLARMPELGHLRQDLADEPLRFWPIRSYLIVYRAETRPIQIVRVLHAARDVRRILNQGS